MNPSANRFTLLALALSEWLLVLPAALLLLAGPLFIGLPGVAVVAGSVALWLAWRRKEALRQDAAAALESLRRHFAVAILGTGTLVAAAILAAVVAHLITD